MGLNWFIWLKWKRNFLIMAVIRSLKLSQVSARPLPVNKLTEVTVGVGPVQPWPSLQVQANAANEVLTRRLTERRGGGLTRAD